MIFLKNVVLILFLVVGTSTYAERYIDNGNGTIKDTKTGLMWKKCSEGQTGNNCAGKAGEYTWNQAMKQFSRVNFTNYDNWRIPTMHELKSLIYCSNGVSPEEAWNNACDGIKSRGGDHASPTIQQKYFPNTSFFYWSSSINPNYKDHPKANWMISFYNGSGSIGLRTDDYQNNIRLVRRYK